MHIEVNSECCSDVPFIENRGEIQTPVDFEFIYYKSSGEFTHSLGLNVVPDILRSQYIRDVEFGVVEKRDRDRSKRLKTSEEVTREMTRSPVTVPLPEDRNPTNTEGKDPSRREEESGNLRSLLRADEERVR